MAKKDKKSKKVNKKDKGGKSKKGGKGDVVVFGGKDGVKENLGGFQVFPARTYKCKVTSFEYTTSGSGWPMIVIGLKGLEKDHPITKMDFVSLANDPKTNLPYDFAEGSIINRLMKIFNLSYEDLNDKKKGMKYVREDPHNTIGKFLAKKAESKKALKQVVYVKLSTRLKKGSKTELENNLDGFVTEEDYEEALEEENLNADE